MTPTSTAGLNVLVVSECFEAGTGSAIESIATELTDIRFHLLWAGDGKSLSMTPFATTERLSASLPARVRQVRRAVQERQVDLVHAHSSWAGVYTRVRRLGVPVVYQPHCFGFANLGRSRSSRMVSHALERLLARRTDVIAAVSAEEARTALSLGLARSRVRVVPNSSTLANAGRPLRSGERGDAVIMIGRLATQKDPRFFAELARRATAMALPLRFVWIGDGAPQLRSLLEASGVEVTGWLDRKGMANQLDRAFVYVHTALAEGFPISILDAAAFGLPIVARPLTCFAGSGLCLRVSPEEFARELADLVRDPERYRKGQQRSWNIDRHYSRAEQGRRLREAYAVATTGHHPGPIPSEVAAGANRERGEHA